MKFLHSATTFVGIFLGMTSSSFAAPISFKQLADLPTSWTCTQQATQETFHLGIFSSGGGTNEYPSLETAWGNKGLGIRGLPGLNHAYFGKNFVEILGHEVKQSHVGNFTNRMSGLYLAEIESNNVFHTADHKVYLGIVTGFVPTLYFEFADLNAAAACIPVAPLRGSVPVENAASPSQN